jgi:hypothetical protein
MSTRCRLRGEIRLNAVEWNRTEVVPFNAGVEIPPVNLPVKHHLMAMQVPMHVCQVVA